jgi:hypothetical protein
MEGFNFRSPTPSTASSQSAGQERDRRSPQQAPVRLALPAVLPLPCSPLTRTTPKRVRTHRLAHALALPFCLTLAWLHRRPFALGLCCNRY